MEFQWLIPVVVVLFVVVLAIAAHFAEQKRRRELTSFARQNGLQFTADVDPGFVEQFEALGLRPFGQGRSRRASNLVYGRRGDVQWELFDYRYTTGSGKNKTTHRYGVAAARVPLSFPRTALRPEGLFDRIASLAGFDDINFESEAFSRRYHVSGVNRRFVYDLVHPRMMEYLMSLPAMHWQLAPGVVMVIRSGRFDARELPAVTAAIDGLLSRVPAFVRQELGAA
jgi:hypothetical protein